MGALRHEVKMSGNAIVGRDLKGQTRARFATMSISMFEARIAAGPVPATLVHRYI